MFQITRELFMSIIDKLKGKWTKFYQPEQNWDIDICITKTTRKHLVHRIVNLYINRGDPLFIKIFKEENPYEESQKGSRTGAGVCLCIHHVRWCSVHGSGRH